MALGLMYLSPAARGVFVGVESFRDSLPSLLGGHVSRYSFRQ